MKESLNSRNDVSIQHIGNSTTKQNKLSSASLKYLYNIYKKTNLNNIKFNLKKSIMSINSNNLIDNEINKLEKTNFILKYMYIIYNIINILMFVYLYVSLYIVHKIKIENSIKIKNSIYYYLVISSLYPFFVILVSVILSGILHIIHIRKEKKMLNLVEETDNKTSNINVGENNINNNEEYSIDCSDNTVILHKSYFKIAYDKISFILFFISSIILFFYSLDTLFSSKTKENFNKIKKVNDYRNYYYIVLIIYIIQRSLAFIIHILLTIYLKLIVEAELEQRIIELDDSFIVRAQNEIEASHKISGLFKASNNNLQTTDNKKSVDIELMKRNVDNDDLINTYNFNSKENIANNENNYNNTNNTNNTNNSYLFMEDEKSNNIKDNKIDYLNNNKSNDFKNELIKKRTSEFIDIKNKLKSRFIYDNSKDNTQNLPSSRENYDN